MQKFGILPMALLRMLCRAAFICNVCFMLALAILWLKRPDNTDPGISSLIIVMGFFLAVVLNILVTGWLLILRIRKKQTEGIPRSLIIINGGFMAIQLILLIK
jgi:hypothetical protein